MIRINLLSVREIKGEVGRRQDLVIAGLCVGVTLVIILAVFLYQLYRSSALGSELGGLRKEIAALDGPAKEVTEMQRKVGDLKQKLKIIDDLSKKKVGPVRVMESLSGAAPESLWLTEFKESSGNLSMTGTAVDNQTVAVFLKALSASPYFANVELVETRTDQGQGKAPFKRFSLRSRLFYQLPAAAQAAGGAGTAPAPGGGKKP